MERLVYFTGDIALVDNLSIEDCMAIQEPLKKLHKYENLEEQCHKQNCFSLGHLLDKWKCFLDEVHELLEYRRLKEQGLLLRLPCKIGDVVYSITRDFISEYTICSIEKYNEVFFFNWRCEKGIYINVRGFVGHEIGKTVFLTKEEAEQKLAEMKGVENAD